MKTPRRTWWLIVMFASSVAASTNMPPSVVWISSNETTVSKSQSRSKLRTIALTPTEVDAKSVRITTKRKEVSQPNLVFHYVGKTSNEIKSNDNCQVQIMKSGKIVLEAPYPSSVFTKVGETNFIGMLLVFNTYEEAELAAKTLRGN